MKRFVLFVGIALFALGAKAQSELNDHLIAHWSFDESFNDVSKNAFNAKGIQVDFVDGPIGHAVQFNSVNDRIVIEDENGLPPQKIAQLEQGSISMWFSYQSVGTTGNILPIFYYGESEAGTPHNSLIIEIGHAQNPENRKLYFTIINQKFCFDSKINIEENTWYHFVAVVGDDFNTGYLNGEEMTARHYNLGSDESYSDFFANVPTRELLSIGYGRFGQQDPFFTYKGAIDDVRIYDKPLTALEVKSLFEMGDNNENTFPNCPEPTFEAVKYGEYQRNEIDFWQAESDVPAPMVVFIHGGGFINGDRLNARLQKVNDIKTFLENGYSYASISYRLKSPSVEKLYEGTRLDTIMLDCARSIQFLRSKAEEWNIDPERIGAYGGSAGGGASLWIGTFDDLADPNNADPVLRESSRIQAIGHQNSQATYNWPQWPQVLDMDSATIFSHVPFDDVETWQMHRKDFVSEEGRELGEYLDMLGHITEGDPPIYTISANENIVPGNVIHHPRHCIAVKNKCDQAGTECVLQLKDTPQNERVDFVQWMMDILSKVTSYNPIIKPSTLKIFPNPARHQIEFSLAGKKIKEVAVYDSVGHLIKNDFQITQNHIGISQFSAGIYQLKVIDENGDVYFARFVKQ